MWRRIGRDEKIISRHTQAAMLSENHGNIIELPFADLVGRVGGHLPAGQSFDQGGRMRSCERKKRILITQISDEKFSCRNEAAQICKNLLSINSIEFK